MRKPIPIEKRFWDKVDKRGDGECWDWKGYPGDLYGHPYMRHDGVNRRVTEISLLLHNITVYSKHYIYQSCKNRICVNPAHLEQVEKKDYHTASGYIRKENHRASWLKIKEGEFNRWRRGKESADFHFHMCITEKCRSRWLCKKECHSVDHPLCQPCFDVIAKEMRLPGPYVDEYEEDEIDVGI